MAVVRTAILYILLSVSSLLAASPTDRQLYEAYLRADMQVWKEYIANADWESADAVERKRVLCYEYGLVPYLLSAGDTIASRKANKQYKTYIESAHKSLKETDYLSHKSAAEIYSYVTNDAGISGAINGWRYSKAALKADSTNPLALYMRANVYFHYPKMAGGNKKKALECYRHAEQIMEEDNTYRYHWMYAAVQLAIAQCDEKTGDRAKSMTQCRKTLRLHPEFKYVKESYLPTLSGKQ